MPAPRRLIAGRMVGDDGSVPDGASRRSVRPSRGQPSPPALGRRCRRRGGGPAVGPEHRRWRRDARVPGLLQRLGRVAGSCTSTSGHQGLGPAAACRPSTSGWRTSAVMDAAGLAQTHVLGLSEGGPVAIAFAATYADQVQTLSRCSAQAPGCMATRPTRSAAHLTVSATSCGGGAPTTRSPSTSLRAQRRRDPGPGLAAALYERQSATPSAIAELLEMVRGHRRAAAPRRDPEPTLVLHRRGDRVVPVALARAPWRCCRPASSTRGDDRFAPRRRHQAWIDPFEAVRRRHRRRTQRRPPSGSASRRSAAFRVIGGEPVAANAWARARPAWCANAWRWPSTAPSPGELADLLWPDRLDPARRSARLGGPLNIRRVLGGGIVADTVTSPPRPRRRGPSRPRRRLRAMAAGDDTTLAARSPAPSCPRTVRRTGPSPPTTDCVFRGQRPPPPRRLGGVEARWTR